MKYKDDRNMRRKHIAVTERALEFIIGALRNIDVGHYEKATKQLHMALDHVDSVRAINNQTWKRYNKLKRVNRKITENFTKLRQTKPENEPDLSGLQWALFLQ